MPSYSDIRRMLNDKGVETEKVDFHAFYDRKLTRHENMMNFASMHGVGPSRSYQQVTGEHHDNRQIGRSVTAVDKKRTAKRPGYRKTRGGGYYERRKNRSDRPGRRV